MGLPYLQVGNLYFVPVIRQRLNFAVLVRQALRALPGWGGEDLLAVAVPPSAGPHLRAAVAGQAGPLLPISLLIATWKGEAHHEVFPVTPADGTVEAIRCAEQFGWPIEWIDQDIVPGNLRLRACLRTMDWVDDGLALCCGAAAFLDAVAPHLDHPPIRFDPVDVWREEHMAERLRALAPRYRRVLVVCEAVHVRPLCRQLRAPGRQLHHAADAAGQVHYKVIRPSVQYRLNALDDFPRLVERYERQRHEGEAAAFDKLTAFFDVLPEALGMPISTRALMIFRQFLTSLLEQSRRVSPRLEEVEEACLGCFGPATAGRVSAYLAGYGNEISLERVSKAPPQRLADFQVVIANVSPEAGYVSRFCNPSPTQYTAEPPPLMPATPAPAFPAGRWTVLAPTSTFEAAMRTKAANLARQAQNRTRVTPFTGSLHAGLDLRRTLRSCLSETPTLYVKERTAKSAQDFFQEPIVWLLRMPAPDRYLPGYTLTCHLNAWGDVNVVRACGLIGGDERIYSAEDGAFTIGRNVCCGRVTYYDDVDPGRALTKRGDRSASRVPIYEIDYGLCFPLGEILRSLHAHARRGTPWWDMLFLSAITYAGQAVLGVVPEGFQLSPVVRSEAAARGKKLLCIHLTQFSRLEIDRMTIEYAVSPSLGEQKDNVLRERVYDVCAKLGIA
jgi:hypothetical protein